MQVWFTNGVVLLIQSWGFVLGVMLPFWILLYKKMEEALVLAMHRRKLLVGTTILGMFVNLGFRTGILPSGRISSWMDRHFCLIGLFLFGLGSFFFAAILDARWHQVYDLVWIFAIGIPAYLAYRQDDVQELIPDLIVFIFLQVGVFGRLYGKADVYAFCSSALYLVCMGKGLTYFFLHMTLAFFLLICVQLWKRNVGRYGKLKTPAPFIPYIFPTLLGILLFSF